MSVLSRVLPLVLLLTGGCYAPMSTGAVPRPTTSGQGGVGVAVAVEYPVLDVLQTATGEIDPASPGSYPTSRVPLLEAQIAYGLSSNLDLELGTVAGMHSVLPVPHAGFIGARHHTVRSESIDFGIAARAGYGGLLIASNENTNDGSEVRMVFGAVTAGAELRRRGWGKPGLALTVTPMRLTPDVEGLNLDPVTAVAASLTLSVRLIAGLTPFATGGIITATSARDTGPLVSFGLAWSH